MIALVVTTYGHSASRGLQMLVPVVGFEPVDRQVLTHPGCMVVEDHRTAGMADLREPGWTDAEPEPEQAEVLQSAVVADADQSLRRSC